AVAGVNYQLSDEIKLNYNIGYASRNPAVNELYSNGLHQGVSGIEEGDIDLQVEKSVKTTFSVEGRSSNQLFFEGLFFLQNIQDYIYLQPQDEFRLTIRGAFPVFRYEQTNAQLYGTDWTAGYHILDNFQVNFKYSYLRGQDVSNNMPLIGMPSNNLLATANYQIVNVGRFENVEIELNHQSVFEQKNLLEEQDFVLPPETYHLLNTKISGQYPNTKSRLNLYLKIDNLLNTTYRDYLNRQRYFADDLGRNITIGGTWIF
ncbi:MAG: TonB-dependent receptor domain-containing protein, partial [Chitinophagales bacterium]